MNPELSRKRSHYKKQPGQYFRYWMHNMSSSAWQHLLPSLHPNALPHTVHVSASTTWSEDAQDWRSFFYPIGFNQYCCWVLSDRKKGKVGLHLDDLDNAIFSPCVTWLTLVLCWRLRQCYRRTILDNPDKTRTVLGLTGGRWLLAVRMCSQRGALCHLCCSPGRREECERRSGSRRSFRYETSP